jgi:signal transduction histidine kinase
MHWFTAPAPGDGSGGRRMRLEVQELPGGGRLLVGRPSDEHERLRGHLRLAVLIGLGSAIVLAIGAGLGLSHGLLRRVKGMTDTVRRIRAGEHRRRVRVGSRRDEFDELAQSFNDLLDENEDLVGQVRGIADDVAHDLRTPLTRLRSRVEATLAAPREGPEYVDALEGIRQDVDAVLETFQALLAITQLQNTSLGERMVTLDLGSIVRDAVELYEPAAEEAGSTLEVAVEGDVEARGEPQLLTQALTNLIDNAIKYAATDGPIQVFARGAGPHVELGVADRGPGIPPDQRERALRRFVRLDASRHLPGTGLGLSFVAAVARAHGAELALGDGEPGLVVTLRLPR